MEFFVPGFIIDTAISRTISRQQRSKEEFILTLLTWSCLSYALTAWIKETHWSAALQQFSVLFIGPVIICVLVSWLSSKDGLDRWRKSLGFKVHDPIPTAWDKFFSQGQYKLVLVTLNDGTRVGGLFAEHSYAASYPADHDIYLEETWKTDPQTGAFEEPIVSSGGIWLVGKDIKYIEFYYIVEKEVDAVDQRKGA